MRWTLISRSMMCQSGQSDAFLQLRAHLQPNLERNHSVSDEPQEFDSRGFCPFSNLPSSEATGSGSQPGTRTLRVQAGGLHTTLYFTLSISQVNRTEHQHSRCQRQRTHVSCVKTPRMASHQAQPFRISWDVFTVTYLPYWTASPPPASGPV